MSSSWPPARLSGTNAPRRSDGAACTSPVGLAEPHPDPSTRSVHNRPNHAARRGAPPTNGPRQMPPPLVRMVRRRTEKSLPRSSRPSMTRVIAFRQPGRPLQSAVKKRYPTPSSVRIPAHEVQRHRAQVAHPGGVALPAHALRQAADHDRSDEQHHKRYQVLGFVDRQGVVRLGEEEVEQQRCENGRENRWAAAPAWIPRPLPSPHECRSLRCAE